jgi:hypothetical protein
VTSEELKTLILCNGIAIGFGPLPLGERPMANGAAERLLPGVDSFVRGQVCRLGEVLPANLKNR